MKSIADWFSSWGSKKQQMKGVGHSKEKSLKKKLQQQQEEQTHEQLQQKIEWGYAMDSNVGNASKVTSRQPQGSYSDLEDEVFERVETCSLNESIMTSEDARGEGDDGGTTRGRSRSLSKTLPSKRMLPSIVIEKDRQEGQSRGSRHDRHWSESRIPINYSSVVNTLAPQGRPMEVTFDESAKGKGGVLGVNYFRSPKKASFTVKYTKVYGEAEGAYRNDSTPRGLVFVCNFSKFKNDEYSLREGSDKDYDNMLNLFLQMGYNPYHRRRRYCMTGSITKKVFMQRLEEFAKDLKHKLLCSCVVILMSHGTGPRTFVTSDNLEVDLLDVYKIFNNVNCQVLLGKPKIFILQFCRSQVAALAQERPAEERQERQQVASDVVEGLVKKHVRRFMWEYFKQNSTHGDNESSLFLQVEERSRKASLASLSSSMMESEQDSTKAEAGSGDPLGDYQTDTHKIAAISQVGLQRYSDMYSIFSTSPGELSHRHPARGSLLIQAICHVFAEYAYQDEIDTLVRRVSTYMTKTLQKDDPITVPRQTCERTNNGLDKLFYFNPYEMTPNRQFTI